MNVEPETAAQSHPHADGIRSREKGPDDAAIRHALEQILSSALFARSQRLRSFLAYVIAKDMAGEAHQLKGYTIGIDVFRRSEHFNADNDPIVRVHAGKLRKLLAAYYETEGREAIWRIEIPKGAYAPIYRHMPGSVVNDSHSAIVTPSIEQPVPLDASAVPVPVGVQHRTQLKPLVRKHWLPAPLASPLALLSLVPLLLFVPLTSAAFGVSQQTQSRLSAPQRHVTPEIPSITVRSPGKKQGATKRLAVNIRDVADSYPFIVSTGAAPAGPSSDPLAFTITALAAMDRPATRIILSNDRTGTVLLETLVQDEEISTDVAALFEAAGIVSDMLAANGRIFRYARDTDIATPLMRCMLATETYRQEKSRRSFIEARRCQSQLIGNASGQPPFVISAAALHRRFDL